MKKQLYYYGEIVGTIDENDNFKPNDSIIGREICDFLSKGNTIGISSRRFGEINSDNIVVIDKNKKEKLDIISNSDFYLHLREKGLDEINN